MKSIATLATRLFLAGVVTTLVSCAGVQTAATPTKPDQPEPGKGMVTFYRERAFAGGGVSYKVNDGDTPIGGLPNGSYFVAQASPGPHRYNAKTESTAEKTINIEAGKRYYVRGEVQMGLMVGRPKLTVVTPEEAVPELNGLRRVELKK